jgi:hypothetical protein
LKPIGGLISNCLSSYPQVPQRYPFDTPFKHQHYKPKAEINVYSAANLSPDIAGESVSRNATLETPTIEVEGRVLARKGSKESISGSLQEHFLGFS